MLSNRQTNIYHAPQPNLSLIKPQVTSLSFFTHTIKFIGNYFLGNKIGELILSSQRKAPIDIDFDKLTDSTIDIQQHVITTHDGLCLDTAEFRQKNPSNKSEITVIYLPGAGNLYQQDMNEYIEMAKNHQCTVVTFNYRGTGNSSGKPTSEDHLIIDCIAQVQRLIENGVAPESVILYSPSLGGAIGAKVAHYFDLIGSAIHHINFKSFSSMTNVITGLIRTQGKTGHYEYPSMIALGFLIKPIVKSVLWASGWELEAFSHYTALPDNNKLSLLVRSTKNRRNKYGPSLVDDPQITHYASMYAALKYAGKPIDKTIKSSTTSIGDDGHSYQCKLIDRYGNPPINHLAAFFKQIRKSSEEKIGSQISQGFSL